MHITTVLLSNDFDNQKQTTTNLTHTFKNALPHDDSLKLSVCQGTENFV